MLPSRSEILAKAISMYEISAWTGKSDFMDEICPKGISSQKQKKSEHHHWTLHIRIILGIKFQLRLTISFLD